MISINEAKRSDLLNKSRDADKVKEYGTTRYERRNHVGINPDTSGYNKIDMDALFRGDMLSFFIPIDGETDSYEVEILLENILGDIKDEIKRNGNNIEFKCIYKAVVRAVNRQDIYVSCSCP